MKVLQDGAVPNLEKRNNQFVTFLSPVALARIQANITQEELARLMNVTQAYVSQIENQEKVTAKIIQKVIKAITEK